MPDQFERATTYFAWALVTAKEQQTPADKVPLDSVFK